MWLGGSSEVNVWLNVQVDSSPLLQGSSPWPGKLCRKNSSRFCCWGICLQLPCTGMAVSGDVGSRSALDAFFCPFRFTVIAANVIEHVQFWILSRLPHFLNESLWLSRTAPCLGTMTLYPPLNNCLLSPRVKKRRRLVLSCGFGPAPACAISPWKGNAVKDVLRSAKGL